MLNFFLKFANFDCVRRPHLLQGDPGDFNAKIEPQRSPEEHHIGTHGLEWNEQGERLPEFIMSTKTIHGNSHSRSLPPWNWEFHGDQFHNEINHIIFNRRYCLTDVSVVPKFYTGSDHRLLRARFRFSRQGEKAAKFKKRSPEQPSTVTCTALLPAFGNPR
ncbi:unnamed protein product [Heligmosomoides polygyrus]|uniref:Endo/exonuclease/phosphatase domain-containing protein n=1 Tax=Heligmosomoides polygyrus TaxID=6339 RepID=A0A183F5E2_HELPZ|nr:unnamed protein product [Heligmosomoides polygyrus]